MTTFLIIIAILLVGLNAAIFAFILRPRKGAKVPNEAGGEGLKLILNQVNDLRRTLDDKLGENTKSVDNALHRQFSESQRLIKDITSELVQVKEIGRQSLSVQDQLRDLEDILKNPKQRGILGEYYLETLLKNVMAPGQYQMQYVFKNGEIVDAAVFVKDKVIPIDSKFSLENYNRMISEKNPAEAERLKKVFENDLKLRIMETAKYVRPAEKTMDFAFMFIPHEAIYYDLLVNKIGAAGEDGDNLIQRAASKYKVIIVSPTSFLAYLQTVLQGLKALQIEETAKDIVKRVEELGSHLRKYEEYHLKLGVSLGTVVSHYSHSQKELKKVDKDVLRITGEAPGIGAETLSLEKPDVGE
jgi:DNA recombination protein RmuC